MPAKTTRAKGKSIRKAAEPVKAAEPKAETAKAAKAEPTKAEPTKAEAAKAEAAKAAKAESTKAESGKLLVGKLQPGQVVFLRGGGRATIEGLVEHAVEGQKAMYVKVKLVSGTALIPAAGAPHRLRPPATKAECQQMLAELKRPGVAGDSRSREERLLEVRRVQETGTPLEHAALLRRLYGLGDEINAFDRKAVLVLEETVLEEICWVLGLVRPDIEKELRALYPDLGLKLADGSDA